MVRHLNISAPWTSWTSCPKTRCLHIGSTNRGVALAWRQRQRDPPHPQWPSHNRSWPWLLLCPSCHRRTFHSARLLSQTAVSSSVNEDQPLVPEYTFDTSSTASTRPPQTTQDGGDAHFPREPLFQKLHPTELKKPHGESNNNPSQWRLIYLPPFDIDARALPPIIDTLRQARKLGLPDTAQPSSAADATTERPMWQHKPEHLDALSIHLLNEWDGKRSSPSNRFSSLLNDRSKLPVMANDVQQNILQAVNDNDVLIIRASTGSGKTTQIPQIILDQQIKLGKGAFCNIAITQPRRISATSVARRVAVERDEPLGQSVGYSVRFASLPPQQKGSLLFCTSGILLKRLRTHHNWLENYSHIIIDEVHERSTVTDCSLTMLRDLIRLRKAEGKPHPKLILMSATIESRFFEHYFDKSNHEISLKTATMSIAGRLFPVTTHYLQDFLPDIEAMSARDPVLWNYLNKSRYFNLTERYIKDELQFAATSKQQIDRSAHPEEPIHAQEDVDTYDDTESTLNTSTDSDPLMSPIGLVVASVMHVLEKTASGDILVFVTGIGDIDMTADFLTKHPQLQKKIQLGSELRLFKLHSALAETNDDVFEPVPPGCRRIVLATNIAETSITLPDIEHVIDLGKVRQKTYEPQNHMDTSLAVWISRSNRKQREGRAGRVRPGNYYALFTRERSDSFEASSTPEITRMELADPCLSLKASSAFTDVREFLKRAPSPPTPEAIDTALVYLQRLGALTADENITPLGRLLANIPLHPSMMKAVLLGILFQCLEPMLIIACSDIDSRVIATPHKLGGANASRRVFAAESESDFIALVNAIKEYERAERTSDFEKIRSLEQDRHVRSNALREISRVARQVCEELSFAGLLPFPDPNKSVFASIPPTLNKNADCVPLLKALTMNLYNSDIAVRKGKSPALFRVSVDATARVTSRSVNTPQNVALRTPRKLLKPTDLMSYIIRRQDTQYVNMTWLLSTTMVTPLLATIFSRSLRERNPSTLILNDWLDMQIRMTKSNLDPSVAIRLVIEFRKAFDRFCILAFTDLEEAARRTLASGFEVAKSGPGMRAESLMAALDRDAGSKKAPPKHFVSKELRAAFVDGMIKILEADELAMKEIFASDAAEWEQHVKAERAEQEAEKVEKERKKEESKSGEVAA